MSTFLKRFGSIVLGVLCGFDRIRFRGSKLQLCYPNGILGFLQSRKVPMREFRTYAQEVTETLFQAIEPPAKQAGLYRYLNTTRTRPEEVALEIASQHGKAQGLIAVIGRV